MYLTTVITIIDRHIYIQDNLYLDILIIIIGRYMYLSMVWKTQIHVVFQHSVSINNPNKISLLFTDT